VPKDVSDDYGTLVNYILGKDWDKDPNEPNMIKLMGIELLRDKVDKLITEDRENKLKND
jgi:hypothetical protein